MSLLRDDDPIGRRLDVRIMHYMVRSEIVN